MDKLHSERSAEPRRPARRSMAELAVLLTPGAVIEQLPARIPVANTNNAATSLQGEDARVKPAPSANSPTSEPAKKPRSPATPPSSAAKMETAEAKDDATSQQLDEVTLAAAHSARLYRSWMFENLTASFTAALDQAADLVSKPLLAKPSVAKPSSEPAKSKPDLGSPRSKPRRMPPNEAADDYRAKLLQLTNAAINANLDYGRKLATVRSPAEFIELSADQVCGQVKLCVKHAVALARLSRSFAAMGLPES